MSRLHVYISRKDLFVTASLICHGLTCTLAKYNARHVKACYVKGDREFMKSQHLDKKKSLEIKEKSNIYRQTYRTASFRLAVKKERA